MKITEHFDSEEFACRNGTPYPEKWRPTRLLLLCQLIEVIRAEWDRPIEIVSGYRTEAYNRKIGGARRSQHMEGRAADFTVQDISTQKVQEVIARKIDHFKRAGLRGFGSYPKFTHCDVREGDKFVRWNHGTRTVG